MSARPEQLIDALRHPRAKRIAVAGDFMLDRYLWGESGRLSPEAPVPVVRLSARRESPGGAGNTALNLVGLDAPVTLLGVVGADPEGGRLRAMLAAAGAEVAHLVTAPGRGTTVKTRVFAGHQQVVRVDEEPDPRDGTPADLLLPRIPAFLASAQALVISDYGKGGLPEVVCRALLAEARRLGLPALVDPKGRDFSRYAGATSITPNRHELLGAIEAPTADPAGLAEAGEALRARLGLEFLLATLGEEGMLLVEPGGCRHFPTQAREVFDVSGAGDTVVATLAWGLVQGLDLAGAVALANRAAGQVVERRGVVACSREALLRELAGEVPASPRGAVPAEEAADRVRAWQRAGRRVVFTNGCFDLLHEGHLEVLERARALGDHLVVGLNSDASVRALKGPDRPVLPASERARLLTALDTVDLVVVFDAPTPAGLIAQLGPDVLVKGADWTEADIVGADLVRRRGGSVARIPLVPGHSTSALLARIRGKNPSGEGA